MFNTGGASAGIGAGGASAGIGATVVEATGSTPGVTGLAAAFPFALAGGGEERLLGLDTGVDDALDEDEWDVEYDLLRPDQIVIADDTSTFQVFGDSVFCAPQEDLLEGESRYHKFILAHCIS